MFSGTSTDTAAQFPAEFNIALNEVNDKPADAPPDKPAIKCSICGVEGFDPERLAVTWPLTWFNRGVIGSFKVAHVPARHPEERDTSGIWGSCIDRRLVSWISFTELESDPQPFFQTLRASNVRVTDAAITDLARILKLDKSEILGALVK